MAKTLRHLALSGLILGVLGVAHGNVTLTGLRIQVTEEDRILHNIHSETASLSGDRSMVEARALTLSANEDTTQTITSFAPRALVHLGGDRTPPAETAPAPSLDEIYFYDRNFSSEAVEGDVLLLGEGNQIETNVGDSATLHSERLIWSALYERLLIPVPFRQTNQLPGGEVVIVGEALSVDHDFREWTYFALPESDIEFEYSAAPLEETP